MTTSQFKTAAIGLFNRNNTLQRGTKIKWVGCRNVTWRDGSKGFSGEFTISHPSHRTVMAVATLDGDGLMVR